MELAPRSKVSRLLLRLLLIAGVLSLSCGGCLAQAAPLRAALGTRSAQATPGLVDLGAVPGSQRLSLTLTLAPSADRVAALDQFLAEVAAPSSASYRKWVTPQQFAASYGASAEQIAQVTAWLEAQGLSVDAVSPAGMRMTVSGFASQLESAFATSIHNYQLGGVLYFADAGQPSLPAEIAALVAGVEGLDDLPRSASAQARGPGNSQAAALTVAALAGQVEANSSPVLALDATGAVGDWSTSGLAGLSALFRQAAAQGITTVVLSDGSATGFPVGFPEVTAVVAAGSPAGQATAFVARPAWQFAPGLPADGMREAPDFAVSSLGALTQALGTISLETGGRLGNINPTMYQLAPTEGLFTQPDGAAAGTWEPATGLGLVDPVRMAQAFPHGTGTMTLQVSASNYSPTHGQSFTLTVTATSTNGGPVPTGTITFTAPQAGFTANAATLNGGGVALSSNYLLPGGSYSITAAYSGDANYAAQSGMVNVTVQPEAAVFAITAPASVSLGSTITATVSLSSASGVGTPSASVTVTPSGITGAQAITQTVAGSGGAASAQFVFTTKQAGNVSLQASCTSSDQSFSCYTPQTSTTTVPQATPTVALSVTPASPTAGQQVTLTATVTGVAGIGTTGSVQFFDGANSVGFGSAPTATFTGTMTSGNHTITAVYQGDSNYLKATSNAIAYAVGTTSTTTAVSASATTASYGQAITLNVTVSGATVVNGPQPTGTLTFTGAGSTTTATVSNGSANVVLTNLGVGTYTIGTSYSGDANFSASTGNAVTVTVTQATANLSSSISSTSFTTGSTATLTTTITLPGNAQLAAGTTFIATIAAVSGATYTGTFAINPGGNTGTGALTIPAPPSGTYSLTVTCGTIANFTCAANTISISSTAMGSTGTGATGTTPTMTVLAFTPSTPAAGQSVVLTATVSSTSTMVATTPIVGTVNFYDGTTLLGNGTIATIGANGVATYTGTFAASTTAHSVTAVYQGNTVYASSTSTASTITIAASQAAVSLVSNVTSTIAGTSVVLTATVTGSTTGGSSPTGTVSFYIMGTTPALIGTASVGALGNGVGTAVFSTSNLPAGSLSLYASYNGDTNFSSAVSNTILIGLSDYVVAFVPQTMTVARGQTATATAVVTLINSFAGSVLLGCAPPPNVEMTCGFNPEVIQGGGPSTLTVTTIAPKLRGAGEVAAWRPGALAGGASLAALVCCLLPGGRRRRLPTLLMALLAMCVTMSLAGSMGCSGDNFNTPPAELSGGTPLGTTLLTITTAGTNGSSTVRHNYTFQVTVQ